MNLVNRYFALHERIQAAKKAGDYLAAAEHTRATTPLFVSLVAENLREYGRWDIKSSVAVKEGGAVLMALGDHEGLSSMHAALSSVPQLSSWAAEISDRAEMARIGDRLVALLGEGGEALQASAKDQLGIEDGRSFSNLCAWLEKVGRIERVKIGKSHTLRVPGV